ncbi:TetR family transcriptional regulator [Neoasaia chiangmaiensis]|uniref:TetR family transcriptional regulator n=1 Tax=Neoasaia chiangmaiensis TaxID=320497 RepID=A0A1U9KTF2_9PROT|nr:TetR/AcrR family transcriptional regulator [Neoasaia chiangmaiensis]AQS89126.1 TetR family transcriptional regulator [Neoasaia chiangmaiensis]GEN16525.1 TetR family transcriptional regulator [Neoasaia chiangmaiensis]
MGLQATTPRRGPKPRPETRLNLIRAGGKLLHESGYAATGIKDIVDAANVPKGSFYNHFASKEEFGREVVDAYFGNNLAELRSVLTDPDVAPMVRLQNYFDERIRGFETSGYVRGCMLGNLSLEVADQSAIIRSCLSGHFKTWGGLFEQCIADAQHQKAILNDAPPAQLAQFLLNGWEGAILRMRVEKSDAPLKNFVQTVFEFILK